MHKVHSENTVSYSFKKPRISLFLKLRIAVANLIIGQHLLKLISHRGQKGVIAPMDAEFDVVWYSSPKNIGVVNADVGFSIQDDRSVKSIFRGEHHG